MNGGIPINTVGTFVGADAPMTLLCPVKSYFGGSAGDVVGVSGLVSAGAR